MVIRLDPRNLEETARYIHALFAGEEDRRVKHKIVTFGGKEYDLELFASESFALEALEVRNPGALFSGMLAFDLRPAYRKGAHNRLAKLQFNFEKNALDNLSLQYTYGKLDLYLDWYLEAEPEPPSDFASFVEEGETLNRKYEADPNVDRDVSNIQNLHLFPVFRRSPFFGIFETLYNEIMARLLKPVEHEELHTDTGDYDEALELAEEERLISLSEGYDPSLDFGPVEEAEEAGRLDLSDLCSHEQGYYRLAELLKEANFKGVAVKEVPGGGRAVTLRAHKEILHKTGAPLVFGVSFLIAPGTFAVRPTFFDGRKNMDFVSRSLVVSRVPMELPYKIVTPMLSGEWSEDYDPDMAIPEFRKIYAEFLEVINTPVAHHELHGDLAGYEEAVAADRAMQEAIGLYKGPKFDRTRWEALGKELEAIFRHELTIRIDERQLSGLTEADSMLTFNRGASHSDELIQIIVTTGQTHPEFSVHLYGDELTRENIPRTIEEMLNFPDAYFVGGPDAQNRVMGHAEPGEVRGFLTTFRLDPEAPALEKFYEEAINRLFAEVEHYELHTDTGYEESGNLALLSELPRLLSEEAALLSEAREVLIDSQALDKAITWAKERFGPTIFVHDSGPRRAVYFHFCDPEEIGLMKTKPSVSVKFQFNSLANKEECLDSIVVNYKTPQEIYASDNLGVGIIDIVEGYPIPATWEELAKEVIAKYGETEGKFIYKFRRLKYFPEIREAFEGFIERVFEPVAHEELHTDVGAYEESRLSEAVIKIAYAVITPESAEEGGYAEEGWADEKGHNCEPDEFDREEGLDRVDLAALFLRNEGASNYIEDDVYEGSPDTDYTTGAETTNTYHLTGFSEEELEDIRLLMKGKERPKRSPEHFELHTDVGSYEESLDPVTPWEFFRSLKPGDHFIYNYENKNPEEYVVVSVNKNSFVRAVSKETGRAGIFWYNDTKLAPVEIPEHEELHTDVGAYAEARLKENLQLITREEWAGLEPGSVIIPRHQGIEVGRYEIISRHSSGSKALPIIQYFASSLTDDWRGLLVYEKGKWYWEKPIEHEELHTDVGAYEESK